MDIPTEWAAEAEARWGDMAQYAQSTARTSSYTDADWRQLQSEAEEVEQRFADLMAAGVASDSSDAAVAVTAHREHISRWFYDCSPEMQRGLAEMYVADPRFAEHYDRRAPGLATYVRDAIIAATSA